ncbi:MAG: IS4 family transposase [Silvanigrellaceae bacterium]|nr:IS4 family transposase [Silvanigrellaceae bacterium]
MNTVSNITQKIINFLDTEVVRIAKSTGFTQRHSKLIPSCFMKALLATCFSHTFNLTIFSSFLKEQGIKITRQGLHERFNARTERFLKELCSFCLKYFETEKLCDMPFLKGFRSINIVDSSTISLPSILNTLFKGSGGNASEAALKIQVMFDYLEGQVKALTLTSGCDNDQGFNNYFKTIEKGALYLMDLGYFKLDSFKKIIEGGAFFVSRLLTGTKILISEGKPIELIKMLSASGHFFSQHFLIGVKDKIAVRLVAERLPDAIAEQRRRKLNESHRRRGRKPSSESLALQTWSIYITNTNEMQINDKDIHKTYSLRWQIELFFKLSKSLMNINSLQTQKIERVLTEIYGKFIAMMLLFLICAPVRYLHNKELSLYKACKLLISKVNDFMRALASLYRLKHFLSAFHEALSLFAIKDKKVISKMKSDPLTGESF